MKKTLKFKTYLKRYCRYLTSSDDYRLSSFVKKLEHNHRAMAAVMLYSLYFPNEKYFFRMLPEDMKTIYLELLKNYADYHDPEEFCAYFENHDIEFKKVYLSYKALLKDAQERKEVKEVYKDLFLRDLSKYNLSKYRVCKDNELQPANFSGFLKGKLECLSLENCEKIRSYFSKI